MKQKLIIMLLGLVILSFAGPAAAQYAGDPGTQTSINGKLYGIVESMPAQGYAGEWVISGRKVLAGRDTYIKEKRGKAAVGAYVEVKGQQTGDVFTAYKIEVEGSSDTVQNPYPGKFYGTVENMPDTGREGIWVINGRDVLVTLNTLIEEEYGKAAPGAYVEVKGDYSGKTFTAYKIEVKGQKRLQEASPSSEKTYPSKPRDYFPQQERVFNSRLEGVIEGMPKAGYEGIWIIQGRNIEVTTKTIINETGGRAAVGAFAKVKGVRSGETISAIEIDIEMKR
ncbi:MAG: DUF5666 domain-containing protein [Nitrospirota bacterium]